jgi:hypothetical protein
MGFTISVYLNIRPDKMGGLSRGGDTVCTIVTKTNLERFLYSFIHIIALDIKMYIILVFIVFKQDEINVLPLWL